MHDNKTVSGVLIWAQKEVLTVHACSCVGIETHREALDQPLTLRAQVLLHSQRIIHRRGDLLSAHTRSA